MTHDPGFDITLLRDPMGFLYGSETFGPQPVNRPLADIQASLRSPGTQGPETVYVIAMDVGKKIHRAILSEINLLYGVVMYATGTIGCEPVRSQGHIHSRNPRNGLSTPEVYEIWDGHAIIYMQEFGADNPGRCFAVEAGPGETVVVPPGWVHATISSDPFHPLVFGAWCDRDYGFEYEEVRTRGGIAWFPVLDSNNRIEWERNPAYSLSHLVCKAPDPHPELGLCPGESIYATFERDPETFLYVPEPQRKNEIWNNFIP